MKTLHVVCNAHIDPVWFWDWREGLNEAIATCTTVVSFLDQYRWLTFAKGEAAVYAHIERYAPELFRKICGFVENGRWEVVGGTMVQPDTNYGAGEAYLRQFLYGGRYYKRAFGFVPEVAWNVDSFGHAATMPMLYRAAGCRYAVQCRPSQKQMPTPGRIFRWRAPEGSEILTVNLEGYGIEHREQDPFYTPRERIARAFNDIPNGCDDWILLIGVGDHGGALTKDLVQSIAEAIENPPCGWIVKASTAKDFFKAIGKDPSVFPVVEGALQRVFRGCYSASASLKGVIRSAEALVDTAERASSTGEILAGSSYPRENLERAWSDILFNHFHDIFAGTCTRRATEESFDHLGRARHESREALNHALLPLALCVNTEGNEGVPILFFNSLGCDWRGVIETEWLFDYKPTGIPVHYGIAEDPFGKVHPVQFLPPEASLGCQWRFRGAFEISVPPCGYAVYYLKKADCAVACEPCVICEETAAGISLDNGILSVYWNRGESGIRVKESSTGREWFAGPGAAGVVVEDCANTWGGDIAVWNTVQGVYTVSEAVVVSRGPVKASFLLKSSFGANSMEQEFSLYATEKRVRSSVRLLWNSSRQMMKLVFPTAVGKEAEVVHAVPYGISRIAPDCEEHACTGWVGVEHGEGNGFAIAGTRFTSFDAVPNALRMTVLRSPLYCCDCPPQSETGVENAPMEIGEHYFSYAILPSAHIAKEADCYFFSPVVLHTFAHPGELARHGGVLSIEPDGVRLAAFKKADDNNGWVARFQETLGRDCTVTVRVLETVAGSVAIRGWGIATMRIVRTSDGGWRGERADALS